MMKATDSSAGAEDRDLFILHASAETDARFVHSCLLPTLNVPPDRLLLSSRLPLGQRTIDAVEHALTICRVTVIVLTPTFLRENWASYGEALASYRAALGNGRLVPIILSDCELPAHLDMWVRLDLRDPARREMELSRLRAMLQRAPADAADPPAPASMPIATTPRPASRLKHWAMQLSLVPFMAVIPPAMANREPPVVEALRQKVVSDPHLPLASASRPPAPITSSAPPSLPHPHPLRPNVKRNVQHRLPSKAPPAPAPAPAPAPVDLDQVRERLGDLLMSRDFERALRVCNDLGTLQRDIFLEDQCLTARQGFMIDNDHNCQLARHIGSRSVNICVNMSHGNQGSVGGSLDRCGAELPADK